MKREKAVPIMLIVILAFWTLDEAQKPSAILPHWAWFRPVIVSVLFISMAVRIWRGRLEA